MGSLDRNFAQSTQNKKKKMLIIGIGICIVLIILLATMVIFFKAADAKTFKLYIDDKQVACSKDFYTTDEQGRYYVKAKELAELIGWTYQNGSYGTFTEETDGCYFQNGYEIASLTVNSVELKKYIQISDLVKSYKEDDDENTTFFEPKAENGTTETSKISAPVISVNNQIYIPFEAINDICNCYGQMENEYRMHIYEQNYLTNIAMSNAADKGYKSISGIYENIRALAYGKLVVENNMNLFGVVNLFTGAEEIGFKYSEMVFSQNVKEFLVKAKDIAGEETVGIISQDGNSIVSPVSYENMSILSDELGLYLVEKNGKYGVVNREGRVIVHAEYNSIGLSEATATEFYTNNDNKYLIYDKLIPVELNGKYGLYNIDGKRVYNPVLDELGYMAEERTENETDTNSDNTNQNTDEQETPTKLGDNVLLIDKEITMNGVTTHIQGVVVKFTNSIGTFYGIFDAMTENLIIPCSLTRVYSVTSSGETTYYMEFAGDQIEFEAYARLHLLQTPAESENETEGNEEE